MSFPDLPLPDMRLLSVRKNDIATYCQERRKWGMPKNILKKAKKVFDRGGGRVHKRFSPLLNDGGRFFDK